MQKVEIDYMMRGHILSDDIEDVEYVDVSNPQPEPSGKDRQKPSFDRDARAKEVAEYAEKKVRQLNEKNDPLFSLLLMASISFGAQWADDNPKSKFATSSDRSEAFHAAMDKVREDLDLKRGKKDPMTFFLFLMSATLGLKWADDNPPK